MVRLALGSMDKFDAASPTTYNKRRSCVGDVMIREVKICAAKQEMQTLVPGEVMDEGAWPLFPNTA